MAKKWNPRNCIDCGKKPARSMGANKCYDCAHKITGIAKFSKKKPRKKAKKKPETKLSSGKQKPWYDCRSNGTTFTNGQKLVIEEYFKPRE